jgi:hypothetical protein
MRLYVGEHGEVAHPTFACLSAADGPWVTLSGPIPANPTSLSLDATVEARVVGHARHPIVVASLKNVGKTLVAVSKTHGFGAQMSSWLSLRIKQGEVQIPYPPDSPDLLMEAPGYVCLRPGESLKWEIDLLSWTPELGGKTNTRRLSFALTPGAKYALQAEYSDSPEWARAAGNRCAPISGTVVSRTLKFAVP